MHRPLETIASDMLGDVEHFLAQIKADDYTYPLGLLFGSSIGQHTRHILDGYTCLLGLNESETVSYDNRLREVAVEKDPGVAIGRLRNIRDSLAVSDTSGDTLILEVSLDCESTESERVHSSFRRELVHNIEHTIHHLAIIKIALRAEFQYVEVSDDFGVAPSTIRFRNQQAAVIGN